MITILLVIFLVLLLLVGKERGAKTFFSFILSLFLLILYVRFMALGINPILLAIIVCILATVVSLFILNGYNNKTKSSFISIMLVLMLIGLVIFFIGKASKVGGFSVEELDTVGMYNRDINYNMNDVIMGIYLVCIIGTVIDTSISISSAMNEILVNNPNISNEELFKSGMNVGKDILSTTINTLYFAIISGFIGFFMWHRDASIGYVINYKAFAQEVLELLLSFIASILIIPITAYISSKLLRKWF